MIAGSIVSIDDGPMNNIRIAIGIKFERTRDSEREKKVIRTKTII